ncbi:MAG: serine hydrolase [Bacteroidales bacterium]|nr:serine hydrolase [Bacteroidales bacterium]
MKKIFFVLVFLSTAFYSFSQLQSIDNELLTAELQKVYDNWKSPAIAVAIVKDGEIAYEKGFGVLEYGKKQKTDEFTNFAIASNTKEFTSAALAILVDEGRISWDDKVRKYIPWFTLYDPYVSENMTIRDLLCHRSGLETFSGDLIWYGSDYSREEVIKRAQYLEPVYGFREHFGYSNIMFLTAGQIIEYVTDTTWDDFLKYRFFEPLGMTRTNTSIKTNAKLDNVASCHTESDGETVVIPYINWDNIGPAGSINSNVHDMCQWLIMQLNKGTYKSKKIFSTERSDEMWSAQTVMEVSPFTKQLNPSTHLKAYGLGWTLYDYKGYLIVTHNGGYDGMISQTVLIPELNTGFVVLTNSLSMVYMPLMNQLLDYLIDGEITSKWSDYYIRVKAWVDDYDAADRQAWIDARVPNTKPSYELSEYTGIYSSDVYGDVEISIIKGNLYLTMKHTEVYQGKLEHWHFDTFSVKFDKAPSLPEGSVTFIVDKYGKINEMKIDIPNPDFDFTELKLYKQN